MVRFRAKSGWACAALVILAVGASGCVHRIDFGPQGEVKDARELLKLVDLAESQVFSVKGEAKIRAESPRGKGVVTVFMAVMHPSLLHLESLDFFGRPQSVLISDGQEFGLYQAEEGKYYRGPATAQNISRFLPVVLPPQELTALMLGRAPRLPEAEASLALDEKAGQYVVTLVKGEATQTLWIDPKKHRVLRSEVRGVNAYDLAFENLEDVGPATYPRRVTLTAEAAKTTVELNYKDVAVNEQPDLTLFERVVPANVPIVDVDEVGNPATGPK